VVLNPLDWLVTSNEERLLTRKVVRFLDTQVQVHLGDRPNHLVAHEPLGGVLVSSPKSLLIGLLYKGAVELATVLDFIHLDLKINKCRKRINDLKYIFAITRFS